MVPVTYHDFFAGCATVAGALIGLLFVAISVSPEKLSGDRANATHQVKAGAAFSALVNTLVVALVALMPGTGLDTASIALACSGIVTTAGLGVLLWREHQEQIRVGQVMLLFALAVLYSLQLVTGIQLGESPRDVNAVDNLGVLAIGFFLFAILRAWQLVGARDTSLVATVAAITHRQASRDPSLTEDARPPGAGPPGGQGHVP